MQHSKYLLNRNPNQSLSKIKPHFRAPIPMGIFFLTTHSTCLESLKHPTHDNWLVIWMLLKPLGFFIASLILTTIIYFWIFTPFIKVHGATKIQLHKDIRFSTKGHSSPSIKNVIMHWKQIWHTNKCFDEWNKTYERTSIERLSHLPINSCVKCIFNAQYQCVKRTNYIWTNVAWFLFISHEILSLWW